MNFGAASLFELAALFCEERRGIENLYDIYMKQLWRNCEEFVNEKLTIC
jgi:hypothetical protein